MGMVEKVARHLWSDDHMLALSGRIVDEFEWLIVPEADKKLYRIKARTAMRAMRVPTDAMISSVQSSYARDDYIAMIDKALESGE